MNPLSINQLLLLAFIRPVLAQLWYNQPYQGNNFVNNQQATSVPQVLTSYGSVRGKSLVTWTGTVAHAYYGIPYARPPIGNLRWQAPQPPSSWAPNVWQAVQLPAQCPQKVKAFEVSPKMSEDCLYLNVLCQPKRNGQMPVLVIIHGGGFEVGSAASYDQQGLANTLVSRAVVVVSMNYRLGSLGFYQLYDNPPQEGNYGILDMIAALEWVQKEITNFGGDPSKVTVYGESAGSTAVSMLTLMNGANNLFEQGIQQSNSALVDDSVLSPTSTTVQSSIELATKTNCYRTTAALTLQCLRAKPWRELIALQSVRALNRTSFVLPWRPTVTERSLKQALDNRKKRKMIYAVNKDEFVSFMMPELKNPNGALRYFSRTEFRQTAEGIIYGNYKKPYPKLIDMATALYGTVPSTGLAQAQVDMATALYGTVPSTGLAQAQVDMATALYGTVPSTGLAQAQVDMATALYGTVPSTGLAQAQPQRQYLFWFNKTIEMATDGLFAAPQWIDALQMTQNNRPDSVYFMSFDHVPAFIFPNYEWSGVPHELDVEYLVGKPGSLFEYAAVTQADKRVSEIYSELVANFVKYGNPTPFGQTNLPTWTALRQTSASMPQLSINSYSYSVTANPAMMYNVDYNARSFWADTVVNYLG